MPTVFKKFSEEIFKLGFTEEPDHLNLLSILMQMDSSYFKFGWNKFIKERKAHHEACILQRDFGAWTCNNKEHETYSEIFTI